MANKLKQIVTRAKQIRKKHPRKHTGKKAWTQYLKDASASLKRGGHKKRSVGARKPAKKKAKKRQRVRVSDTTVMVIGSRPTKRRSSKRKSHHKYKRVYGGARRVSGSGKNMTNLLLFGGLALGAIYLLTRKPAAGTTAPSALSLIPTSNPTRDAQAQNILAWASAIGMTASAISAIIAKLNSSSDQDVSQASSTLTNDQVTPEQWQAWYNGD